eukprot:362542-Chlamydomonas_euryale.AAC.5
MEKHNVVDLHADTCEYAAQSTLNMATTSPLGRSPSGTRSQSTFTRISQGRTRLATGQQDPGVLDSGLLTFYRLCAHSALLVVADSGCAPVARVLFPGCQHVARVRLRPER